ncbi:MAG TPA: CARDB domain-containing protein, partial [Syntrophorhabdus sp.]|nr:CARDB domain-containing protein [Syntrophorhabdus sp.]
VQGGYETISIAYPTGNASTSVLRLTKTYPRVVKLNDPFECTLKVENLTNLSLKDVSVSEVVPTGFLLDKADPNYSNKVGQDVTWDLGTMSPSEIRTIVVSGKASSKDALPCCTSAKYDVPSLCSSTSVVQPAISVDLDAASSVTVCEQIPLTITVKNTGDSSLRDVDIDVDLPDGVTSSGKSMVTMRLASLGAGESKEYKTNVQPQKTGVFSFKASAEAEGVSDESDSKTTVVDQPKLTVTASSSRNEIYVGRAVDFTVKVNNSSTKVAESTVVKADVSGNARVASASDNGSTFGSGVTWRLGALQGNASKDLSFSVTGTGAGTVEAKVEANAICADPVMAKANADIKGIPALLLEVIDVADPVEVGAEETYIITVTNQGSAAANNIKIVATLDGMSYVSDSGMTQGSAAGETITFSPVSSLRAGQVAEWKLKAKGTKAGDLRFKVVMTSDELTTPVQETESTYVY